MLSQLIVSGLAIGSLYGLVGVGIALIHRATRITNFMQGHLAMMSGMTAAWLTAQGQGLVVGVLGGILVSTTLSVAFYWVVLRPTRDRGEATLVLLTLAGAVLLSGVARVLFGPSALRLEHFPGPRTVSIAGAVVSVQALWMMGITVLLIVGMAVFLSRTWTGQAMRASASDRTGATLIGIEPTRMDTTAFLAAGIIGGIAGAAIAPILPFSYLSGATLSVKGIIAFIFGGMGSYWGALVGGLVIGLLEVAAVGSLTHEYRSLFVYVLLFAILIWRPEGVLGRSRA